MRKTILGVVALIAIAAPVALIAAPAEAANPSCATRAEFRKVHNGQSVASVARIVGSKGKVNLSSPPLTIRQWKTCSNPYGNLSVGFWGGRVQSKVYIG